jgi:HEPN domain-containing protein
MADSALPNAKAWLTKASHDLETARLIRNTQTALLDVGVYHCQQAAEKAVKAFLVHHQQPVERTHDIEVLLDLASAIDPAMSQLADAADALTPYASRFRYPNAVFAMEPERAEFEEALQQAELVYEFVRNKLPESARPN